MRNIPYWLNIGSILHQYGCATRGVYKTTVAMTLSAPLMFHSQKMYQLSAASKSFSYDYFCFVMSAMNRFPRHAVDDVRDEGQASLASRYVAKVSPIHGQSNPCCGTCPAVNNRAEISQY